MTESGILAEMKVDSGMVMAGVFLRFTEWASSLRIKPIALFKPSSVDF